MRSNVYKWWRDTAKGKVSEHDGHWVESATLLRPMHRTDLNGVIPLAAAIHEAYPEDDAVFVNRLELFPAGCWVFVKNGRIAEYVLSHPWPRFSPPLLNQVPGTFSASPDSFYIHDLAVAPWARASGAGRALAAAALQAAWKASLPRVGLVAVGGSESFWEQQGFAASIMPNWQPNSPAMEREPAIWSSFSDR